MKKVKREKIPENRAFDRSVLDVLGRVRGVVKVASVAEQGRREIERVERQAEAKSLMGLGKVVNSGLREVLRRDRVFVALTDMEFEWGCQASLVMKKGDQVVGEEVRDPAAIEELSGKKNVWFLHRNFVVYKDRVSFPQDVMEKICHFEIPSHTAPWLPFEQDSPGCCIFGFPSTPCDVYLKERYFECNDSHGFGTVLIGVAILDAPQSRSKDIATGQTEENPERAVAGQSQTYIG